MHSPDQGPTESRRPRDDANSSGSSGPLPIPAGSLPIVAETAQLSFYSAGKRYQIEESVGVSIDVMRLSPDQADALSDYIFQLPMVVDSVRLGRCGAGYQFMRLTDVLSGSALTDFRDWMRERARCFAATPTSMKSLERFLGIDTTGLQAGDSSCFLGLDAFRVDRVRAYVEVANHRGGASLATLLRAEGRLAAALPGVFSNWIQVAPEMFPNQKARIGWTPSLTFVSLPLETIEVIGQRDEARARNAVSKLAEEIRRELQAPPAPRLRYGRSAWLGHELALWLSAGVELWSRFVRWVGAHSK